MFMFMSPYITYVLCRLPLWIFRFITILCLCSTADFEFDVYKTAMSPFSVVDIQCMYLGGGGERLYHVNPIEHASSYMGDFPEGQHYMSAAGQK